jgi:uncharacterized protein (TIGR02266 family)
VTPERFAKLPKDKMFAELRQRGIVHGQGNTKAELVRYFREWYAAQAPSLDALLDDATERREARRARIDVEIGIRTETNFFVGFSGDISEGGIFVATVSLLPIGTSVTVSFSFPGGIDVEVEGEVAWTREGVEFDTDVEPGMGIRFSLVSRDALAAIREFMRVREPIFYAD